MTLNRKYLLMFACFLLLLNINYIRVFASDVMFESDTTVAVGAINLNLSAPNTPSIISVDGLTTFPAVTSTRKPLITSSAYSNPGDIQHSYTDWEVYSDTNLTQLFAFIRNSDKYLTEVKFGKPPFTFFNSSLSRLGLGSSYWIRVRYINVQGLASSWSQPIQITAQNSLPTVPSIISPADGQKLSLTQPTIIWNKSRDDDNPYVEIRYILCLNPIPSLINCRFLFMTPTGTNKFTIPLDLGLDSSLYIAIKAVDINGGASSYSPFIRFTTASSYPKQASLLSGAGYASILNSMNPQPKFKPWLRRKKK